MKSEINLKFRTLQAAFYLCIAAGLAMPAFADTVALSSESGQQGQTVVVDFTYTADGTKEALQAEAIISDATVFSNINASAMCSGASAVVVSCGLGCGGTCLQVAVANGSGTPLTSFTGTVEFTIDGAAPFGVVTLDWDTADVDFTPNNVVDGQVEVTEGPSSSLSIAPDPMAFGTVDIGNMPVTDTFTVTIGGDAGADDVLISDVTLTGDTEFSIVADNCEGNTFTVPDSCTIDVQFDSAAAGGPFAGEITVTSDANNTPVVTAQISGSADSVANIETSLGAVVNIGAGAPGTTVSMGGQFTNSGSADGEVSCTLTDPDGVFSTDPTPITNAVVPAGGSLGFTLFCDLPELAEEGEEFFATLSCTGTNDFASEHQLSCGVSTFEAVPVPTMQAWTLALFAMLMLLIGGFSIRFFRAS